MQNKIKMQNKTQDPLQARVRVLLEVITAYIHNLMYLPPEGLLKECLSRVLSHG